MCGMQCLNIPQEWFWYIIVSWEPLWYDEVCVSCSNIVPRAQHKRFVHSTFMQALYRCVTMPGLYVKYRKAIHDPHATCAIELHAERGTTDRYGTACFLAEIITYFYCLGLLFSNLRHVFYMFLALENDSLYDCLHRKKVVITYWHCNALY